MARGTAATPRLYREPGNTKNLSITCLPCSELSLFSAWVETCCRSSTDKGKKKTVRAFSHAPCNNLLFLAQYAAVLMVSCIPSQ